MEEAIKYLNEFNVLENTPHHNYDYLYNKCIEAIKLAQKDSYNHAVDDVMNTIRLENKIISIPNSNDKIAEVININYDEIVELKIE